MKKQHRLENEAEEIILVCDRCKYERSVIVTWETIAKPPKPCPSCGCQEWTQKKAS